ncbi:MAG: NAD-dependent epimerase/dehydratase family protein [Chitinispirillaceae bacterium]
MKIFLTGGSGFIGSWVVKTLLEKGHELTVLVRNPDKLPILYRLDNTRVVEGGFAARTNMEQALQGQDACVHIGLGWGDTPQEMLQNDTAVTVFLLEKAAEAGVKKFIFTSSTAAVGEIRQCMTPESVCRPVDLYGATKAASEAYILGFSHNTSMKCNIIRPGYTFGNPAFEGGVTQPDRRFHNLVENALKGEPLKVIRHDGTQFISAADLAKVYSSLLESEENRQVMHGLGTRFISWEEIGKRAIEMTGSSSKMMVEDKGWGADPALFDVSFIKDRWGLAFDGSKDIDGHLRYLLSQIPKDSTVAKA